jgi:hypothetical protein
MMWRIAEKTLIGKKRGATAEGIGETATERLVVMAEEEKDKKKTDLHKLAATLDEVEKASDLNFTDNVLDQILDEANRLLATARVAYPVPNRVSLSRTIQLIRSFTTTDPWGDRTKAVCAALFHIIAREFGIFDEACREKVDEDDAASELEADIECKLGGRVVLQVAVRDRPLTTTQVDVKVGIARTERISGVLFLTECGIEHVDRSAVEERIAREFVSGQNIYVSNFVDFSVGILILLGEKGRSEFIRAVGEELDRTGSPITHRQAWVKLLRSA